MDALKGARVWAGVGVAPAPVWGTLPWRPARQEADEGEKLLATAKRIVEAAQLADAFGKNEHA
ncbi:MAG: hypothetical protein HYS06_01325 [Methylocystis sp.]|nr:hypothetical protein [Methylocystis sp.]